MRSISAYLSRVEKQKGKKSYQHYTFINGLSFSFLAETLIYLLALNYGANNVQLGYISSAVYLTGIISLFTPILFSKIKIITLFFVAWLLRGFVSLFYGVVIFSDTQFNVTLILIIYTIFCLLRNISYPFNHVIQGFITKRSERSSYASKILITLYFSMTVSRFISFSTLTVMRDNELIALAVLIGVGIILNTAASFSIRNVPIKEVIEKKSLKDVILSFKSYVFKPGSLLIILLYCGGMSLFVLFNFSIPFLRKELEIPSNAIFIYTTINFVGVILASQFIRPFLDRFGSKPLLIIVNTIVVLLSILWMLSNPDISLMWFFVLGFISMFFIGMIRLLLDRLIINSIPVDDKISFTSALAIVFSIVSLIVGMGGGYLAEISYKFSDYISHEYSLSFLLMVIVAGFNVIIAFFVKEKDSSSLLQSVYALTNSKHRKAIHNIDRLHRTNDSIRKQMILIEIESDDTNLATEEIRRRLKLSTLRAKEMVIRSLFSNPRPELEEELLLEASDSLSWWRQSAIFALGAYNSHESRSVLQSVFREKYPYIRSIAAKSLARIGDHSCLKEIYTLLHSNTLDVRTYINLIIALSLIENNGSYWTEIFRLIKDKSSFRFQQSLLIIGSTRLSFEPPISEFFYDLNCNESEGFQIMLEELIDIKISPSDFNLIQKCIIDKDYYGIFNWSKTICRELKLVEPYEKLRIEIVDFRKRKITASIAFASLYFTYQLMLIHKDTLDNVNNLYLPE